MQEHSIKKTSPIEMHYTQYMLTGNRDEFLSGLCFETRAYCMRRLSRDPDTIGDFIVHLLEGKIDQIIAEFQRRDHPSFPAFYILCIRHCFQNFIRKQRRMHVDTLPLQTDPLDSSLENRTSHEEFWHTLEQALQKLPELDVLLFKIYHSIPLNGENLKSLIREYGAEQTMEMMEQVEARRRFREQRLAETEERISRFFSKAVNSTLPRRSGRHQADLQSYYNRHWSHSIYALSSLFGISRQLAAFRLRRTTRKLRRSLDAFYQREL